MSKKTKGIYIIIVIIAGMCLYNAYKGKADQSVEFVGSNEEYYYGIVSKAPSNKLSDYKVVTYNKDTKKKQNHKLKDIDNEIVLDFSTAEDYGDWLLFKGPEFSEISGINTNTGETRILVKDIREDEKECIIKDFSMYENKIIYSYVVNGESYVEILNVETNEKINVGKFDTIEPIPVSMYGSGAAFIIDGRMYVYDVDNKIIVNISEPKYCGDILVYNDIVFTYVKDGEYENLVRTDYGFNDKLLLEKVAFTTKLLRDGNNIIVDMYFYNINEKRVYLKAVNATKSGSRLLLDDYIYTGDSNYEKLEEGKNYYLYPLMGDMIRSYRYKIAKDSEACVLVNGEVAIVQSGTNKIIKSFNGLKEGDSELVWNFASESNFLYFIEILDEENIHLASFNTESGEKAVISKLDVKKDEIKRLCANGDEVGYLIQNEEKSQLNIYNTKSNETTIVEMDLKGNIDEIVFNDKYIAVVQTGDGYNMYVLDRISGECISNINKVYITIMGITEEGIVIYDNEYYKLVDFNLKEIEKFSDYNKVIEYLY